jgi:hypothetical protein
MLVPINFTIETARCILRCPLTEDIPHVFAAKRFVGKASQKVLEKIGMKFIEYTPKGFQKQGQWIEENKMGITKKEWLLRQC